MSDPLSELRKRRHVAVSELRGRYATLATAGYLTRERIDEELVTALVGIGLTLPDDLPGDFQVHARQLYGVSEEAQRLIRREQVGS